MASKFGFGRQPSIALDYGKILEEDKMYFNDIIAAVKFQYDIVGFFSFEEIFNSRLKLYNRKKTEKIETLEAQVKELQEA